MPAIGLVVSFRVDAFALLIVALVSGIGTLIFLYCASYFAHSDDSRADLGRFASHLTAFAGAMLGLVLVDNLLALYVFWELTSITSYLLIGYDDRKGSARAAALQAVIVTGAGGVAMLAGLVAIATGLSVTVQGSSVKLLLAVELQFLTTPAAAHMVGRAAYRSGGPMSDLTIMHELGRDSRVDIYGTRRDGTGRFPPLTVCWLRWSRCL